MYENTAGILEEYGFHQYEISIMRKADGNAVIIRDTGRGSIIWDWDLGRLHFWSICVFQYCGYEGIYWKQCVSGEDPPEYGKPYRGR